MSVNTREKVPVSTSTFWYKVKLSTCSCLLTDMTEPTFHGTVGKWDSPLTYNTHNYSNACQVKEKRACFVSVSFLLRHPV